VLLLPDSGGRTTIYVNGPPVRLPRAADLVPPELGRRLLGGVQPGDRLTRRPARRVAGVDAAGLRVVPADPHTTIGRVDVWADPRTGLPLRVEVTPRGLAAPILVTRFLDLRLAAPPASVLTPPVPRPGLGFTATNAPDIAGEFATVLLGPLPDTLAGRARSGTPLARVAGTGAYGTGFTQFVVLPVPRQTGFAAFRSAANAGGTRIELPAGEAERRGIPAGLRIAVAAPSEDHDGAA
jgi:hypothetical protein